MKVLRDVDLDDPPHVLFLHQVDNLTTVSNDFERLARHDNLLVLQDLPIGEPGHDASKYLVKVFVDR